MKNFVIAVVSIILFIFLYMLAQDFLKSRLNFDVLDSWEYHGYILNVINVSEAFTIYHDGICEIYVGKNYLNNSFVLGIEECECRHENGKQPHDWFVEFVCNLSGGGWR